MMNNIINTSIILVLILLFSATCFAETGTKRWYAGVTTGIGGFDLDNFDFDDSDINKKGYKYGLLGGYQLKKWLSIEAEITRHQTNKKQYEDTYSTSYVDFTQRYKFAFIGLRATKSLSDRFGFTARLGAGYTAYKSNFERESILTVSSAVGLWWRIRRIENFTVTHELQQIKFPIVNGRDKNDLSMNISLKYRF
ncbi:MAG: porin family protein [Paraglaciecola sp.]|nr:porin family protein [Paraglaciecola sp.]